MLCPVERTIVYAENDPVTTPTIQHIGRHLAPYGWVNRGANDDVWYSFLYQFMAVFRYARGSVRFAAQSEKGTSAVGVMDKMDTSLDGEFWKQAVYDPFFDDVNLSLLTRSAHNFANISEQPADVTIPYFSTTKNQITLFGPPVLLPKFTSPTSTGSILVRVPVPAIT